MIQYKGNLRDGRPIPTSLNDLRGDVRTVPKEIQDAVIGSGEISGNGRIDSTPAKKNTREQGTRDRKATTNYDLDESPSAREERDRPA